jgi:hypothetical protein
LNLKGLGIFMIGVGISGFFLSLFINAQFSGQGAGSWDVVKAALQIESHLSGNDMDVYSFNDPGIQPALAYWHRVCGWQPGHLCLNTLPVGWLRLDTASNQYVQCGGPGNGCAYYDRFHALQCVMFVDAAYAVAGHPLPDINENGGNFFGAYAHIAGWQEVRAGTGLPLPGDLLGMSGGPFGHIAVVVSVTPPQGGTPGSIVIAHANAPANIITPSPYAPGINTPGIHLFQIPLMPDLTVPPVWGDYQVQGYIRNPSLVRYSWSGGNASRRLVRIFQGDPAQYANASEFNTWWPSACSAASMTEVLNAYGGHYRISDVLAVESAGPNPAITPSGGLMYEGGIAKTMAKFGFQTNWGDDHSLAQLGNIVDAANAGTPVIVSFPPGASPLFGSAGHILVVVGGDLTIDGPRSGPSGTILLADSSRANLTSLPASVFMNWWSRGFYAIPVPVNGVSGGIPGGMPSSPWVYTAYNDALKYGISTTYFLNQIKQESGFNPSALSNKGAEGIAQIMPATAQAYGVDPWVPQQALDWAAHHMAQNYQKYLAWTPGDPTTAYARALAEYNAGAGAVRSTPDWFAALPAQTKHYVDVIMNLNW